MSRGLHQMRMETGHRPVVVVLALLLCCGGCAATTPTASTTADDADTEHDPAEPVNRAIFKVNVAADHAVMRPVAQAYADHVPEGVQKGIHNVVQNLKEPAVAVNDALQGNVNQAWQSVQRLVVNLTVEGLGILGVVWQVPLLWPPNWGCHRTRPISARRSLFGASEKAPLSNCLCLVRRMRAIRSERPSTWR